MIGCVIVGTLAAMGIARMIHHRRCWAGPCGRARHFGPHFGPDGFGHHGPGGYGHHPFDGAPGEWETGGQGGEDFRPWSQGWRSWGRHRGNFVARTVVQYVRATPAQERAIHAAFDEFRDEMKKLGGGEGRRTRQEVADAFRKNSFDGILFGELFARHDTAIEGARKAFVGLTARLHDALDEEQRARLAHMLERGPRFFF